jgi:hypothetical protein
MKIKFLVIGLIFWTNNCFCQSDSLKYYIEKLNWDSFTESSSYFPKLILLNSIDKVSEINDPLKVQFLIDKLSDSEKTVAIHIVLTKIFDSSNARFSRNEETEGGSTIQYTYNGVTWERNYKGNKKGVGKISKEEVEAVIKYWESRRKKTN